MDTATLNEAICTSQGAVYKIPAVWPPDGGSDVDIMCRDHLWSAGSTANFLLGKQIPHTMQVQGRHIHLDVIADGRLDTRLDFVGTSPWPVCHVQDSFVRDSVTRAVTGPYGVLQLCPEDEACSRLWEWFQWAPERPDKIKHLMWAQEHWTPTCTDRLLSYSSLPAALYPKFVYGR